MISGPPATTPPGAEAEHELLPETSAEPSAKASPKKSAPVAAVVPERVPAAVGLEGHQIFFLFVGSAVAACLIFVLGVAVGRRVEQRAMAQKKSAPADPLAVLDEIANAEEALTFHRAVLGPSAERGAGHPQGATPDAPRLGRYTLHSSTFAQRPAAEDLLRRLRDASYKAKVMEVTAQGQRPTYRLQIGDFGTAEAAQPIRGDLLQRFGLATTVARAQSD